MSLTEKEILMLRQKVEESEEALQKAAQYGLQLLDDKMDLQNKLEEQRVEMTAVIEGLEQEKYSLQREVELKSRMLNSLQSEFDYFKNQQKQVMEQQLAELERNHVLELADVKNKVEKMKADLDEAQLLEKQMRHKLELQSQTLTSKTEELRKLMECSSEDKSAEISDLEIQKMDLEAAMAALEQELQESHYKEQQLQLNTTNLQRHLETLEGAKEEKECEVVSLYNALEKSREANKDLQIQLDQALEQTRDPNSKGNSLFSEVEDRRVEMERQLISLKVQYQSLQKQHTFMKQQMLRMKVQISNLMQLQGARADPAQLERLQFMLSEKNSEIETLMRKVHELDKAEGTTSLEQSSTAICRPNEFVDETYYIDLLKMQLSNSKKNTESLKDELSMARMKALSESQRVLELERKLFGAENALKQGQSDNIKLQVKLEELRIKYEPDEVNKARAQKRRREKFPVNSPKEKPDQSTVETPAIKSEPKMSPDPAEENTPCPAKKSPDRQAQPPACRSVLLEDNKCVRICEAAPITISDPPHSSDWSSTAGEQISECDEENWRTSKQEKNHIPVRIDPKNTMERQCAQQ